MSEATRNGLRLLAVALLLGIAGDVLRVWVPGRLDMALWIAALLVSVGALMRAGLGAAPPDAAWLAGAAAILIPGLIWRDSEALFTLNFGALLGLAVLAAHGSGRQPLRTAGATDYVWGGLETIGTVAAGPVPVVLSMVRWKELPISAPARRAVGILMGLLMAAPVVLVFGALLGEADPLFGRAIQRIWSLDLEPVLEHALPIGLCAWVAAGLTRTIAVRDSWLPRPPRTLGTIGFASIGTAVAAVAILLLVFILFQARTLFLGAERFQAVTGLTVAEYARRGFFQLVAVAALSLPLLLLAEWLLERRDEALRPFRLLAAVTLVLLLLILASALHRMRLYTAHFGLTELRLYTTAFMAWLAVVFAWFAATVLRGRRSRFAPGTLVAGFVTLVLLNVANPDALIARVNLERAAAQGDLDTAYLARLSADAVPTLLSNQRQLTPADRCALALALTNRRLRAKDVGFESNRSWTLGRVRAREAWRNTPPDTEGCVAAPE
ncbi:MAG TPA: DUF4173 domain-containing protein [Gemmatimonadales bacterium]|nr:DUF4173 domain-containing protein [Gemmatimonadales bacterium]